MMPIDSRRPPPGNLADDEAGVTILRPHLVGLSLVLGGNGGGPGKREAKMPRPMGGRVAAWLLAVLLVATVCAGCGRGFTALRALLKVA